MTAPTPPVETVPAETAPPAVPAAPVPTPPPAPPAQPAPTEPAGDPLDGDTSAFDEGEPADVRKMRRENQSLRARFKEESEARAAIEKQVADLAAKAGEADTLKDSWAKLAAVFNPETDEPVDPAKLAEQLAAEKAAAEQASAAALAERDAQIRTLAVERAAERAARTSGVDPDALLDSRSFLTAAAKLDPTADTFAADLESAVAAAVGANPKLKVAPVATRSGAEIPGRSGGSDQLTLEQVRGMKPAEIEAARVAGRLKGLGIGPG